MQRKLLAASVFTVLALAAAAPLAATVDCDTNRSQTWAFDSTITTTNPVTSCNMDSFFAEAVWWDEEVGSYLLEASIAPTVSVDGINWTCTTSSKTKTSLEASCTSDSASTTQLTITGFNLENLGRPTDCPCVKGPVPYFLKSEYPAPSICGIVLDFGDNNKITVGVLWGQEEGNSNTDHGCRVEVKAADSYKYQVTVPQGGLNNSQAQACQDYADTIISYYKPTCQYPECESC